MNNEKQERTRLRCQGFLTGLFAAVLLLVLGGAALAATHSIQIEDGIKVTINGAYFSPKDAAGKDVPLFAYNGTTYAPIRALCEAAGMRIEYDSATRTAIITTGDRVLATDPNAAAYITAGRAQEIALNHAVVKAEDAVFLVTKLDREDGKVCYEVEFYSGNLEYDYDIDAVTGAILSFDHDLERFTLPAAGQNPSAPAPSTAQITDAQAREIALSHAGVKAEDAVFLTVKLDQDDGRLCYEVEFYSGNLEYDYDIDAVTGAILSFDHEPEHHAVPAPSASPSAPSAAPSAPVNSPSAQITEAQARQIAQDRAPGAQIVKLELDWDNGRQIYEIELRSGRTEYECEIDAATGAVLKWEVDYDD